MSGFPAQTLQHQDYTINCTCIMPERNNNYEISPASIRWNENSPIATQFEDIYFSQQSALDESQYVFLKNNQLPTRLSAFSERVFTIAETGFGSGLNFLTTWQSFQNRHLHYTKVPDLHFISFEKHPIKLEHLKIIYSAWPTLIDLSQQLIQQYPLLTPGWHRLKFNRCTLDIWFGDATLGLQEVDTKFDALYLDGFAPSKNPELWNQNLLTQLSARAHDHTTFSTFTAAGNVRRALHAAGFSVKKVNGFGHKREMLVGHKTRLQQTTSIRPIAGPRSVCVIGAGVSGANVAWQLAERGWQVHLCDTESEPAQHASGNKKAVLYTKVTPHSTAQNDFYRLSYAYAIRFWRTHQQLNCCGVLQLLLDTMNYEKSKAATMSNVWQHTDVQLVTKEIASEIAGQRIEQPAIWFPNGGWVRPQEACKILINHSNILFHSTTTASSLIPTSKGWKVETKTGNSIYTDAVVLSNGRAAETLWPNTLPFAELRGIRGQTTTIPMPDSHHPRCIINHQGYCIPGQGELELGATFQPHEQDLTVREIDHVKNIDYAISALPHLKAPLKHLSTTLLKGKTGIRCQSLDYLPLIGRVPDDKWKPNSQSTWSNLYLCTAMGSRGFTSSPLAADMLASLMMGEALPVSPSIANALRPDRFLLRKKR